MLAAAEWQLWLLALGLPALVVIVIVFKLIDSAGHRRKRQQLNEALRLHVIDRFYEAQEILIELLRKDADSTFCRETIAAYSEMATDAERHLLAEMDECMRQSLEARGQIKTGNLLATAELTEKLHKQYKDRLRELEILWDDSGK